MPLAPIKTWRIHIGAHKTATTHAQEVLAVMRPALLARGIDFIPNDVLRQSGLATALGTRRLSTRLPLIRARAVRGLMAAHLDPLRAGPDAMALSEERLMGGSQHVFAQPIYPRIGRMAALLATLGDRAEVTLFLSIRGFDGQLPSAYVQELKFMPPIAGGFEAIRRRVLARPPSWFDLVRRIRAAAPDTPLRVWRQEDYRGNAEAILTTFCGRDIGPVPELDDPQWTKSPDLAAVRAAEALPAEVPRDERRRRVLEIFANSEDGPRFAPFTTEERDLLRAAYARDVARIAEMDPGILIRV